jgi:hypothetical protein
LENGINYAEFFRILGLVSVKEDFAALMLVKESLDFDFSRY